MKCFKVGDKVKRINTGLIGMTLGTIWTIDAMYDDGTMLVRGSNRVVNTVNFNPVDEKDTFFEVSRYASPAVI